MLKLLILDRKDLATFAQQNLDEEITKDDFTSDIRKEITKVDICFYLTTRQSYRLMKSRMKHKWLDELIEDLEETNNLTNFVEGFILKCAEWKRSLLISKEGENDVNFN